jgi:hypothetical protein
MEGVDVSVSRAEQNDALLGEIGEGLRVLSERVDGQIAIEDFVCECVDLGCTDRIVLTVAEYEAIRAAPARFVVHPDHVAVENDVVVLENDQFTIVEKRGAADGSR